MNLVNCKGCGNQVSPQASSCPRCGHPIARSGAASSSGLSTVLMLVLLCGLGFGAYNYLLSPTSRGTVNAIASANRGADRPLDRSRAYRCGHDVPRTGWRECCAVRSVDHPPDRHGRTPFQLLDLCRGRPAHHPPRRHMERGVSRVELHHLGGMGRVPRPGMWEPESSPTTRSSTSRSRTRRSWTRTSEQPYSQSSRSAPTDRAIGKCRSCGPLVVSIAPLVHSSRAACAGGACCCDGRYLLRRHPPNP
jgi:hypothetical protein